MYCVQYIRNCHLDFVWKSHLINTSIRVCNRKQPVYFSGHSVLNQLIGDDDSRGRISSRSWNEMPEETHPRYRLSVLKSTCSAQRQGRGRDGRTQQARWSEAWLSALNANIVLPPPRFWHVSALVGSNAVATRVAARLCSPCRSPAPHMSSERVTCGRPTRNDARNSLPFV